MLIVNTEQSTWMEWEFIYIFAYFHSRLWVNFILFVVANFVVVAVRHQLFSLVVCMCGVWSVARLLLGEKEISNLLLKRSFVYGPFSFYLIQSSVESWCWTKENKNDNASSEYNHWPMAMNRKAGKHRTRLNLTMYINEDLLILSDQQRFGKFSLLFNHNHSFRLRIYYFNFLRVRSRYYFYFSAFYCWQEQTLSPSLGFVCIYVYVVRKT